MQKLMVYSYSTRQELSNKPELEGIREDVVEIEGIYLISGDKNVSAYNSRNNGRKHIP